jgi:menaquinol-cytochrome c reductase cytochrome b/c subunit
MVDIPEDLLRRTAEAKSRATGVPVERILAEMRGEAPPVEFEIPEKEPAPVVEVAPEEAAAEVEVESDMTQDVPPEEPKVAEPQESPVPPTVSEPTPEAAPEVAAASAADPDPASVATIVEERPTPGPADGSGNGGGNGKVAAMVSARPVVPPTGLPDGVRTQRLLTVVKARAIQNVKPEPSDKVNTWPHLMLMEFGALLAITAILVIMAVIIHSPLLDPANVNATPNPSKAPWYFLGLQELLSYFDPQIAGVMIPGFAGLVGMMMVPYIDKNPSTRPSDRKFAIAFYSVFLAGSAVLTIIGVLFRGRGFNFSYPWRDGVFFDDILDWVHFE